MNQYLNGVPNKDQIMNKLLLLDQEISQLTKQMKNDTDLLKNHQG